MIRHFKVLGLAANGVFIVWAQSLQIAHLHHHPWIFFQCRFVTQQKIPVQGGDGAGVFSNALGRIVAALRAVITHTVNVFAAGGVGLAGHQSPVGKLAHAQRVGQLHPFDGIYVDA